MHIFNIPWDVVNPDISKVDGWKFEYFNMNVLWMIKNSKNHGIKKYILYFKNDNAFYSLIFHSIMIFILAYYDFFY
jgi:hypothetical protein